MGYEHVIDHYRTQICFQRVGRYLRTIIIKPMPNFFNLYEFIKMLYQFAEYFDENPLAEVQSFQFSFACHLTESGVQEYVFGTGGRLLDSLKRLMSNLPGLKHLSLQNLLLDSQEAMYLLDSVAQNCFQTLKKLELINCTKYQYPLLPVGIFLALDELRISPQHLNDDVVTLLGSTTLRNMYIIQTEYSDSSSPVSKDVWKECSKLAPNLNVHLIIDGPIKNLEVTTNQLIKKNFHPFYCNSFSCSYRLFGSQRRQWDRYCIEVRSFRCQASRCWQLASFTRISLGFMDISVCQDFMVQSAFTKERILLW